MDGAKQNQKKTLVFEVEFRSVGKEWVLKRHCPLIPFDLRFCDPEPGLGGAIGYARFIGRKTGGLIKVYGLGEKPRTILFPVERI